MTERLFEQDSYLREADAQVVALRDGGIELDRTVFYARGGGQPGDSGVLIAGSGAEVRIVDTVKAEGGAIVHVPGEGEDPSVLEVGDRVTCRIDWDRRYLHMRMHTALHLLCALVDAPVTGGNLTDVKGRLDFDLPEATVDKASLTEALNALIQQDTPTELRWISDDELAAQPELVKTMSVQPPTGTGRVRLLSIPGVDLQPCGGTHVARTGEIGRVRVSKIEKKSRLNRRINLVFDP